MPHTLDDATVMTQALLKRAHDEAMMEHGEPRHYLIVQKSDGHFLDHNPGSPELDGGQAMFARDLVGALNREIAHDGAWCIVFTNPQRDAPLAPLLYRRFVVMWMDADGDVQIPYEWQEDDGEDFYDMMMKGLDRWLEGGEIAWHVAAEARRGLDVRPSEQFRHALGERAPSEAH